VYEPPLARINRDVRDALPVGSEEQQIALLTPLSLDPDSPLGRFFALVKDMTIDAYYKTEAGLKTELGWHGNTYLASFPGCDHPEHHS